MTQPFESLHPRQATGKFRSKFQSVTDGGVTLNPTHGARPTSISETSYVRTGGATERQTWTITGGLADEYGVESITYGESVRDGELDRLTITLSTGHKAEKFDVWAGHPLMAPVVENGDRAGIAAYLLALRDAE